MSVDLIWLLRPLRFCLGLCTFLVHPWEGMALHVASPPKEKLYFDPYYPQTCLVCVWLARLVDDIRSLLMVSVKNILYMDRSGDCWALLTERSWKSCVYYTLAIALDMLLSRHLLPFCHEIHPVYAHIYSMYWVNNALWYKCLKTCAF